MFYILKKDKNMIKLRFTPKEMNDPNKAFNIFQNKVISISKRNEEVDVKSFYAQLAGLGDRFEECSQREVMNKNSKRLAETLVSLGNGKLAGVIYSFLIKLNHNKPSQVEQLAYNGLAIAKRFNDPVHIMARCEDLNKIYSIIEPQGQKRLRLLYDEKRALSTICKNYDKAQERFMSITRKMKPLDTYQRLLCHVKIRIARAEKRTNPNQAIYELETAKEIANKLKSEKLLKIINSVMEDITK